MDYLISIQDTSLQLNFQLNCRWKKTLCTKICNKFEMSTKRSSLLDNAQHSCMYFGTLILEMFLETGILETRQQKEKVFLQIEEFYNIFFNKIYHFFLGRLHITLFISIITELTTFHEIFSYIPHIRSECEEYFVKHYQSHKLLLRI